MKISIDIKSKIIIIAVFMVIVVLLTPFVIYCNIPKIHDATAEQIAEKCNGIGLGYYENGIYKLGLAYKIVDYLDKYPNATMDDLIKINGIGPAKLKELKKHFR